MSYCTASGRILQGLSQQGGRILRRQAGLERQGDAIADEPAQLTDAAVDVLGRDKQPGGRGVSAQILYAEDLSRRVYAAADLFLMPSAASPAA